MYCNKLIINRNPTRLYYVPTNKDDEIYSKSLQDSDNYIPQVPILKSCLVLTAVILSHVVNELKYVLSS